MHSILTWDLYLSTADSCRKDAYSVRRIQYSLELVSVLRKEGKVNWLPRNSWNMVETRFVNQITKGYTRTALIIISLEKVQIVTIHRVYTATV